MGFCLQTLNQDNTVLGVAENSVPDDACPRCGEDMEPEHAHHKCSECGYIEPCCGW